jgi:diguanylate cyclase (GGDEF)-like protein/PAS domain S-box-containing protein
MVSGNKLGFIVANNLERELVCFAALGCGLEPLNMAPVTPGVASGRPSLAAELSWPLLVLIDESVPLPGLLQNYVRAGQDPPLIVRIGDPIHHDPDTTAHESLVWPLPRPLLVEAVGTTLRQASRALMLLAVRHRSLVDELRRLRSIFGSVTNGITIADANIPDLPLTYVNAAFETMTGYSAAEACGRNCRYLQGSETDQVGIATVREAIREGRESRVVLRNYRKDGTLFWNELYMSPILDLDGNVTHFVGIQRDVTVEVESAQRLRHLANHDALTGVANRTLLMSQLKQTLARAQRGGLTAAVLFFDLDKFKQVNDVLGHDAGDRLLQVFADRLRSFVRAGETVARLGGDEFVVVLEDLSDQRHPAEVLQRLLSNLREPIDLFGTPIRPSASVGMALFPADGTTPEALIKAADMKMYVAKHDDRSSEHTQYEAVASVDRTSSRTP